VQRHVEADMAIASVDGTLTLSRLHVTIEPAGTAEAAAVEATAVEATAVEAAGAWESGS
jgi:hypothetical protein